MGKLVIEEVGIEAQGRLYVKPSGKSFEHVYRAALGVHWDNEGAFLYAPKPKEMSYVDWFRQILFAVKDEYGDILQPTANTRWLNIPEDLKSQMLSGII